MKQSNPYKEAEVRARAVRDFLIHLALFLPSAVLLVLLELLGGSGGVWLIVTVLLWGLGVLLHGVSLLNPIQRLSRLWDEERLRDRYRR